MYMAHTSVRTSNMERSMKFYTELLDMKFVRSKEIPKSNAEIAFLESENGNLLELTWYRDQKSSRSLSMKRWSSTISPSWSKTWMAFWRSAENVW